MTLGLLGSRSSDRLPAAFREAMSELAGGVTIVTCDVGGRPWGTTVTAFQSISAEPPIVMVSLESASRTASAVIGQGAFSVHILGAHQVTMARLAALRGAVKFLDPEELDGAPARLDCNVVDQIRIADHTVFFGHVYDVYVGDRFAPPLVYHRRDYHTLDQQEDDRNAEF